MARRKKAPEGFHKNQIITAAEKLFERIQTLLHKDKTMEIGRKQFLEYSFELLFESIKQRE